MALCYNKEMEQKKKFGNTLIELKWQYFTFGIIFCVLLVIDMVTKHVAEGLTEKVMVIKGIFSFIYVENTGMAFGLFSNNGTILIIMTLLFIIMLLYVYFSHHTKNYLYHISFALIICGGIGNFIDRVSYGYVRDFINLEFMSFPVFNLADTFITIGVVLMVVYMIYIVIKLRKRAKK